MYLLINILGILAFLAVAVLFSKDRKHIDWKSIGIVLVLNLVIALCLTKFAWGRDAIKALANGFTVLIQAADEGISFALPSWMNAKPLDFVTSALLPILLIVPLFDIMTYIGFLPWLIKWIGKGLAYITGQPKFESFFSVEMMFLGNTEALAVSTLQLKRMRGERDLTIAMMSMSCVTASILASYMQMIPGEYVLTAVPLNILNAVIISGILNPIKVTPDEDTIAKVGDDTKNEDAKAEVDKSKENGREPFFSFLGDSILKAGKLILIITANVIAFVALAGLIDKILGAINPNLSLEHILGVCMFPFAWLLGQDPSNAFQFAQYMGTKLVTNEFVVMGRVSPHINNPHFFNPHYRAEISVFLTSFANLGTVGMIVGAFKGIVDKSKNDLISKNVGYMVLSGILVSLMSAGIVGLFVW
ncbi:nucleoside transporter [Philodulcilactobacillus myokoensis]|uniref:Nucleoside transporter n=1 Tax=Philodulcilactobacillus myokoensis TaxID=2929573 RepID=A0A9W6B1R1_9LACO|nr:nucleoside transporter C-terminal domain-containing protein [Philodulcilactobacillus myokoensis]GLB47262.1 nucleoside transporter [Philodulcilactobacillus myokoensis]